ncbi:transglycosylase SLT domain-containing protein [Cellvibrio fontiphilus]|uniref:Transglycosylase SLT domain-containing protein n=1 Tax=Cellvibrio fontiphilus TaxID=1815559 RepID=A0ABV7FG44_9GAMM
MQTTQVLSRFLKIIFIVATTALAGCSTLPPSKPQDLCAIFDEKPSWYKASKKAEKRWGSSVPIMMSIMYQESQFKHNARPARKKILWIFPGPRPSDAYGYPQAKNATWNEYQRNSGNDWSRRDNFADAVDFIGWYNRQSQVRSRINPTDSYSLYLAYHEGHGGFNRGTYRRKNWLINTARKVQTRAQQYDYQLRSCEERFKGSWWWPF